MSMIRIGDLRHHFRLEAPVDLSDGAGGRQRTWQDVGPVWGAVTPISGREVRRYDRLGSEITHSIVVRYRTDINAAMRLVSGSRTFQILAVLDDEKAPGHWMQCHCVEIGT